MIPRVNISRKASVASINGAGGSGELAEPLSWRFRGQSFLTKFLGSKEHLDWLKIDLDAAKISTVQDYKRTKHLCEWKYTHIVLKLRVKQVTYESRYNSYTKRPKLKENHLGILKTFAFCQKFSRGPQVQNRALLGLHIYQ